MNGGLKCKIGYIFVGNKNEGCLRERKSYVLEIVS